MGVAIDDGVARAARAVDAMIEKIRVELRSCPLPQGEQLIGALDFDISILDMVERDFLPILRRGAVADKPATFTRSLAQLEMALVDLRYDIAWSSQFTGFSWWLTRRQEELGVEKFIVLPRPGPSDMFRIAKEDLANGLNNIIKNVYGQADSHIDDTKLKLIRVLTVPQLDGGSPRWHPISLGHEIAHLRWSRGHVTEWLQSYCAGTSLSEGGEAALESARVDLVHPPWYVEMCNWLVEIACDATMYHYYGDEGLKLLEDYLSVTSITSDSTTHPAPRLRLATLRDSELQEFRVEGKGAESETDTSKKRKNAFCDFAIAYRDHIRKLLDVDGRVTSDEVAYNSSVEAFTRDLPPSATAWSLNAVLESPSSIETALVRGYWKQRGQSDTWGASEEYLVEHAVDYLQFAHRFESLNRNVTDRPPIAQTLADGMKPPRALANVLWVTKNGVQTASGDQEGVAAHDLRLGRYFAIFKRNEIPVMDSLEDQHPTSAIQSSVEIGWGDRFVLHPGELVLAVTVEVLLVDDDCIAQVLSRSSLGRMGLLSATAVHIQPGFRGFLTLELVNLASVPLTLHPGQRIAQLVPLAANGGRPATGNKYSNYNYRPQLSMVGHDEDTEVLRKLSESR